MYQAAVPPTFNRLQRKQISKLYLTILHRVKQELPSLEIEAASGDQLAGTMQRAYAEIKTKVNPTLEDKFAFLKAVDAIPEGWNL